MDEQIKELVVEIRELTMRSRRRDRVKELLLIIMFILMLALCFMLGYLLFQLNRQPAPITNNYKIEHADAIVIEDANEIVKETQEKVVYKTIDTVYIAPQEECKQEQMKYEIDTYVPINVKIDNWTIKEEYQELAWKAHEKYGVNYLYILSTIYAEHAYNNPEAINYNKDGSKDIGLCQFNTKNKDIIYKVTKCKDVEVLKKPWANIRCAAYLMKRNFNYINSIESYFDAFIVYNGGEGALNSIRKLTNPYSHPSFNYAIYAQQVMDTLWNAYLDEV